MRVVGLPPSSVHISSHVSGLEPKLFARAHADGNGSGPSGGLAHDADVLRSLLRGGCRARRSRARLGLRLDSESNTNIRRRGLQQRGNANADAGAAASPWMPRGPGRDRRDRRSAVAAVSASRSAIKSYGCGDDLQTLRCHATASLVGRASSTPRSGSATNAAQPTAARWISGDPTTALMRRSVRDSRQRDVQLRTMRRGACTRVRRLRLDPTERVRGEHGRDPATAGCANCRPPAERRCNFRQCGVSSVRSARVTATRTPATAARRRWTPTRRTAASERLQSAERERRVCRENALFRPAAGFANCGTPANGCKSTGGQLPQLRSVCQHLHESNGPTTCLNVTVDLQRRLR